MNTNLKDKINVAKFIKDHTDDSVDFDHESKMIMYRFLSEVERLMGEERINKKELASKIGTSSSYITQLFRGTKLLNLPTVAKIQHALNCKFKIEAVANSAWYIPSVNDEILNCIKTLHKIDRSGFWVSKPDKEKSYTHDVNDVQRKRLKYYGGGDATYSDELTKKPSDELSTPMLKIA